MKYNLNGAVDSVKVLNSSVMLNYLKKYVVNYIRFVEEKIIK